MFKRMTALFLLVALLLGLLPATAWAEEKASTKATTASKPSATSATVTSLFEARSEGIHPRIFANESDFARIRKQAQTDPYMKLLYARIYNFCVELLSEPLLEYEIPDGKRLLSVCNNATKRITWLAMAYQISGEQRFAKRAVEEMINVCSFKDWNPSHYLDTAQMSFGVGLGYDWLYNYMTASQRTTIMNGIYNHGVSTQQTSRSCMTVTHNWNPWCNGGLSVAAAAIFENHPVECAAILANAVSNIQYSMLFSPSGSYPEGPDYSCVGLSFTVMLIDTLDTVLGTDFGLSEIAGMKETGNFLIAANGYLYTFNYGDGSAGVKDNAMLHWYANRYNMPELSLYQRAHQTTNGRYDEFMSMVWYNPELVEGLSDEDSQPDYLVYSDEYESIASFRSNPGDAAQIYTAIKSGSNQTNHTDLDIGTFVMEAMGEAWFVEMGKDNYNLPNYMSRTSDTSGRWTYYRKRAEGQNTIVINPGTLGGQDVDAKCQITDYQSTYDGGYAVVNMKNAYDSYGATSAKRSLALFDNRTRVRLRDEINCSSESTIYWFAHTKAEISISSDGKTAILTQNGKKLQAQLATPDGAKFTKMDAKPLSSSPNPSEQNANEGYRKLVIKLTKTTSASITVIFTPIVTEADMDKSQPTYGISNTGKLLKQYAPGTTLEPNAEGIYEIHNVDQLCLLSEMVNGGTTFSGKTVKLMADIDMKGRSFIPIGGCGTGTNFKGTFDGNNHVVKNLLIFKRGSEGVGFFGSCNGATIKNFGIESGTVFGGPKTGALTGYGNSVTISKCFNRANVISTGGYNGGLVGQMGGTSSVTSSYNNASVKSAEGIAGGIVGYMASNTTATISGCYHVGDLTDSAGKIGLIGFYNTGSTNPVTKVTVKNCRSTASIKSSEITDNSSLESYSGNGKWKKPNMVTAAHGLGTAFIYDCEWENDGYPVLAWQCDTTLPEDLVISTAAQLRLVAYMVNSGQETFSGKTISLARDIDLESREWTPIGGNQISDEGGKVFKGTFDGKGYTVSNLRISTGNYYVGFFGYLSGTVKNFGITNGSIQGANKAGGLAGCGTGTISNCFSRATVTATGYAGGLIGMAAKTVIENCYVKADVTSSGSSAAGLVAYYSSATSAAKITNSYAACNVSGKYSAGLVCSINSAVTDLTITNSYALSGPSLVYASTGYTLKNSSSQSAANLKTKTDALGTAFVQDGYVAQNSGYPVLAVMDYKSDSMYSLTANAEGIYEIHNEKELRALAYMVNELGQTFSGKTVRLCADIDLEGREWVPIGGNGSVDGEACPRFSGTFEGQGHKIKNLSITRGNYYVGFFGDLNGATIRDLGIDSGVVMGAGKVAGLAGVIRSNVKIINCYNKASVCGKSCNGGIVGMVSGSNCLVESCYNTASVGGNSSTGGLVGYLSGSASNLTIQNSYNLGIGSSGIVGSSNETATGTVKNCYTVDTVALVGTANALVVTDSQALTAAVLRASASKLGTAFVEDYFTQNRMFPVLSWENGDRATALEQSSAGAYLIRNADELHLLSYLVRKGNTFSGKTVELLSDIDLNNELWLPIGGKDESASYSFRGTFKGNGHRIFNLNSWEMETGYAGLFGMVYGCRIENLGIESGTSIGSTRSAALSAVIQTGSVISSCYNKALVYAESDTGAFAGMISGSNVLVENCYNVGKIFARSNSSTTAGLVGYLASNATNAKLVNCYNVGNYYGLIGSLHADTTGAVVENTYSVGTVRLVRVPKTLSLVNTTQIGGDTLRDYASVLGDAYLADTDGINRGYPILTWENASHCFHEYTTTSDGELTHSTVCALCGDTVTGDHTWNDGVQTLNPTCTEAGSMVYACTACGQERTEALSELGHKCVTDPAQAPTCTEPGKTEGSHCDRCGVALTAQEEIPAPGHSLDEGTVTKEATCTEVGRRTYTCTVCGYVETESITPRGHQMITEVGVAPTCVNSGMSDKVYCDTCGTVFQEAQVLPRLGHSYAYIDLGDGTHKAQCERCEKTGTESHSYTDGACICGAREAVLDPALVLGHSLNLASDISVNYVTAKTLLAGFDLNTVYLECTLPVYEGNRLTGTTVVKISPVEQGVYYYFTLEGLTAVQMNNRISAVLYGQKNGQLYYSAADDYSIADYAYAQLGKSNVADKLKTLCADLLRYGALAQNYKNYRTDALADGAMTEACRSYLSSVEDLTFGNTNYTDTDLSSPAITWIGKTLNLESKVTVKYVFSTANYTGSLEELSLRVTYTDRLGQIKTAEVKTIEDYNADRGQYAFSFNGLLAAELRSVLIAQIYAGDKPVSVSMVYSPDTYGNGKTGTLGELCKALFAYSDSAKAYFAG
ncbi:MAG: hypothetical protein IKT58_01415 [Oscillospiraceae bacterium]|nr:hypothetical protein [Oscillospiraceae bacterium]